MSTQNTISELLEQINNETGLSLSIEKSNHEEKDAEQLAQLLKLLRSNTTRSGFYKKFLLGQLDALEIQAQLQHYHIEATKSRGLLLVRFDKEYSSLEASILSNIYNSATCDVIQMSDTDVVLIRTLDSNDSLALSNMADEILSIIQTEAIQNVFISYDVVETNFNNLTNCYNNAALAMKVGQTFYSDRNIFAYADLGLGSLLYQIPREACEAFLNNTLPHMDFRSLDAETLNTIKTFFACNLSIAETARALYMHRNTLVYRLDTLKKQTGIDIRKFEDAINCQVGLLLWEML